MSHPMNMTKGESECREELHQRIAALESENAKLRRQVEFCKRKRPASLNTGFVVLDRCQLCEGWLGKHIPDCPHAEESK